VTQPLILASRSQARIALMSNAGLVFETAPAEISEAVLKAAKLAENATPAAIAADLADAKAIDVSKRYPAALVIGADQTLELEGRLFDKPADVDEARAQLLTLRGKTHSLHAAVSLANGGEIVWRTLETARLHVRIFSEAFLAQYLAAEADEIIHCVGAYRLEGMGAQLFERVEGDYFTILGLPLLSLLEGLRSRGEIAS
jgi:septum formation protein